MSNDKEEELYPMIKQLQEIGKKSELEINSQKTKIMSNTKRNQIIRIGNCDIEIDELIYLGKLICMESQTEKEINKRITLAWKKYWSLSHIFKGLFSIKSKCHVLNSCVCPVATYEVLTRSTTTTKKTKIN